MANDLPLLGSPLQRLLLRVRRCVDNTAYICSGCGGLKGGLAERACIGWTCSSECSDRVRNLYERIQRSSGDRETR